MIDSPEIAIIDFGLGNLYNVRQACEHIGLRVKITSSIEEINAAPALILPGVGAFGRAMEELERRQLIDPIRDAAEAGKPLLGICLGMQLLMSWSEEFGHHEGLDIIPGGVRKLHGSNQDGLFKVPHIGWNEILLPNGKTWEDTILDELLPGTFMYFVHSFYVDPLATEVVQGVTQYCGQQFPSFIKKGNVIATQFHPERSGLSGIKVLKNFKELVCRSKILK